MFREASNSVIVALRGRERNGTPEPVALRPPGASE